MSLFYFLSGPGGGVVNPPPPSMLPQSSLAFSRFYPALISLDEIGIGPVVPMDQLPGGQPRIFPVVPPPDIPWLQQSTLANHARNLLANLMPVSLTEAGPAEEYIPPDFRPVLLTDNLTAVRQILFGKDPDRLQINYWVRQYMTLLHATELAYYAMLFDPRVTYLNNRQQDLFADEVFGAQVTPLAGTVSPLYLSGKLVPTSSGQLERLWHVTLLNTSVVQLASPRPQETVETLYLVESGLSSLVDLPGTGIQLRFEPIPDSRWRIQLRWRPTDSLPDVIARLEALHPEVLLNLFGVGTPLGNLQPYYTFRQCWERHPDLHYRLGGVLLAYIYRSDDLRGHNPSVPTLLPAATPIGPPPPPPPVEPDVGVLMSTLDFDEPGDRVAGAGPVVWPVTAGWPLARGELTDAAELCAASTTNLLQPTQRMNLLPWRGGSPTGDGLRFALLDTQVTYDGNAPVQLQVRKAPPAVPAHAQAVSLVETAGAITVDTGAVHFVVSKTAFNLFEDLEAGGATLITASDLYWKDTDDVVYSARYFPATVTVEKTGPLRAVIKAEGVYASSADPTTKKHRYVVRIHAFAGLPYVKIHHTLIWDQHEALEFTGVGAVATTHCKPGGGAMQHGLLTGIPVTAPHHYSFSGMAYTASTPPTNLNTSSTYYVRVLSPTTLSLHASALNASNNVSPIDLSGGTGYHFLQRLKPVLSDFGMTFVPPQAYVEARYDVTGAANPTTYAIAAGQTTSAVQDEWEDATLTDAAGGGTAATQLAGWCDARMANGSGLAMSVQDLAMACPKKIVIGEQSFQNQFWGGAVAMSMIPEDRLAPALLVPTGDPLGWYNLSKEWLSQVGEADPFGAAKTHEVVLWPRTASATLNRYRNDLVQRPPAPLAEQHYLAETLALGHIRPLADLPAAYQDLRVGISAMFDWITRRDKSWGDYRFWDMGDLRLFLGLPTFRTYDNGGYFGPSMSWTLFAATGERKYLEQGVRSSRHVMDVDHCHVDSAIVGDDTYGKMSGRACYYACIHWALIGPYANIFSDHTEHLLKYYLLTGYERAADVLNEKAIETAQIGSNWQRPPSPIVGAPSTTREQYGAIENLVTYYEFTGDEGFLISAQEWSDYYRKSATTAWSPPAVLETDGAGNRLYPNNHFYGFFYRGLEETWEFAGDTPSRDGLLSNQLDFANDSVNLYTSADWAGTRPPYRTERAVRSLQGFAFAHDRTGNLNYLAYAIDRVRREVLSSQRGGAYDGYSSLDRLFYPLLTGDAIRCLASWHDLGYPDLPVWRGNNALIYSYAIADSSWISRLTVFVEKEAGIAGTVRFVLKDSNLTSWESTLGAFRATITFPDTSTSVISLGVTLDPAVTLSAGNPAGQYKIELDNVGPAFAACPKTNLPKLVVQLNATKDLCYDTAIEASYFYIKLLAGQTAIDFTRMGYDGGGALPVVVLDPAGELIDRFPFGNNGGLASSATIDIPLASRTEVLTLLKGMSEPRPYKIADLQGVKLGNCERFVSLERDRFFIPI